jgi:hypothetical protein
VEKSKAQELARYSFLVVFANDDTISKEELGMLERLALRDGVVDDAERTTLRNIFARANVAHLTPEVSEEIERFRREYGI